MTALEIKQKIEFLKREIDSLTYDFDTPANNEDFREELDLAAVSLDDALDVVQRDVAYRELKQQSCATHGELVS